MKDKESPRENTYIYSHVGSLIREEIQKAVHRRERSEYNIVLVMNDVELLIRKDDTYEHILNEYLIMIR